MKEEKTESEILEVTKETGKALREIDKCFAKLESEGPRDQKSVAEMRWHFDMIEETILRAEEKDSSFRPGVPHMVVAMWMDIVWDFCACNPMIKDRFTNRELSRALRAAASELLDGLTSRYTPTYKVSAGSLMGQ